MQSNAKQSKTHIPARAMQSSWGKQSPQQTPTPTISSWHVQTRTASLISANFNTWRSLDRRYLSTTSAPCAATRVLLGRLAGTRSVKTNPHFKFLKTHPNLRQLWRQNAFRIRRPLSSSRSWCREQLSTEEICSSRTTKPDSGRRKRWKLREDVEDVKGDAGAQWDLLFFYYNYYCHYCGHQKASLRQQITHQYE